MADRKVVDCPECHLPGGEHTSTCTRPALLAEVVQARRAVQAVNDCNRTWEDVSDDFVFANADGSPDKIPPSALQDYLERFPQFHDKLVRLYEDWNREPTITDEMLEAVEHDDDTEEMKAKVAKSWIQTQRILRFYDKVRGLERELAATRARALPAMHNPEHDAPFAAFVQAMADELRANAHKGDRTAWLTMNHREAVSEVMYHAAKLAFAAHKHARGEIGEHGVLEFAADVANCALMVADICGVLTPERPHGS